MGASRQHSVAAVMAPAPMDSAEFRRWVRLIEAHTGMHLPAQRKSFLLTALSLRLQELDLACYAEYEELLARGRSGAVEWTALIDRLTIQETRFFRHPPSLELVAAQARAASGPFHALSVGCATGVEAYTLAMVIDEALAPTPCAGQYGVIGSDLSRAALQQARRGVYAGARCRTVNAARRARYFRAADAGLWAIDPGLQARVCFSIANALELATLRLGPMNVVYCQNLLIYFARERREQILQGLVRQLAPGGLLVLGPGEMMAWSHPALTPVRGPQTLAYRRIQ